MTFPPDPAVALRPIPIDEHAEQTGPLHRVQYVIELVGPRTAPSASIKPLLDRQWQDTLGRPQVYVMAAADKFWRKLDASDPAGAYDSIALAWDLFSDSGALSQSSAMHLLKNAEHLAGQLNRIAMALPVPGDVDPLVKSLNQIRDSLDIGVNLTVVFRSGVTEEAVWKACSALGLQYGSTGDFEWRIPGWPLPLLAVSPLREGSSFSLGSMQKGVLHDGLIIGFSVPLSPAPMEALSATFHVAETIAARLGGTVLDENDESLNERSKACDKDNLQQALGAFERVQIRTGSLEARKLFA